MCWWTFSQVGRLPPYFVQRLCVHVCLFFAKLKASNTHARTPTVDLSLHSHLSTYFILTLIPILSLPHTHKYRYISYPIDCLSVNQPQLHMLTSMFKCTQTHELRIDHSLTSVHMLNIVQLISQWFSKSGGWSERWMDRWAIVRLVDWSFSNIRLIHSENYGMLRIHLCLSTVSRAEIPQISWLLHIHFTCISQANKSQHSRLNT